MCMFNILLYFFFFSLSAQVLYAEKPPAKIDLKFPVILEPYEHAIITTEIFTRVISIPFKLGDSFHKGDLLIQFDNEAIKAEVSKAHEQLAKANKDLEGRETLYAEKIDSELQLREAQSNKASAAAELAVAEKRFRASEILAPYDGKVAEIFIHPYEVPTEIRPSLMAIVNDKELIANFYIPSQYAKYAQVGDTVYVYINDTREVIPSKIIRVSPIINPASSTLKVESLLDNQDQHLKAGMPSQASFNKDVFETQDDTIKDIMNQLKENDQPK